MKAHLKYRVTQVFKMNREITEIDDKINFSYRHLQTLTKLMATQNRVINFNLEVTQ